MKIIKTTEELASSLANICGTVGFVPTMGALHAGHASLVSKARSQCDTVVVSVFVNPTQFNDLGDLEKYPRTLEADCQILEREGVDIVFAPSVEQVYPNGRQEGSGFYAFGTLDKVMEGEHRPGHFAGVAQVVGRLFDLVKPQKAYFGEKDFQQLAIIRELERQRGGHIEIIGCPIVRGADGLALSSRNTLLDSAQRAAAPHIYNVISQAAKMSGDARKIETWAADRINENPLLRVEYIAIVDKNSLEKVESVTKNSQLCAAVHCSSVRLIDNISF